MVVLLEMTYLMGAHRMSNLMGAHLSWNEIFDRSFSSGGSELPYEASPLDNDELCWKLSL